MFVGEGRGSGGKGGASGTNRGSWRGRKVEVEPDCACLLALERCFVFRGVVGAAEKPKKKAEKGEKNRKKSVVIFINCPFDAFCDNLNL